MKTMVQAKVENYLRIQKFNQLFVIHELLNGILRTKWNGNEFAHKYNGCVSILFEKHLRAARIQKLQMH